MTEAVDLARRFLALWEDYLTALFSDPTQVELLQPWVNAASALAGVPGPRDAAAASTARNPDRRLAPRPLPAHLAAAMILWLSSRAALPILKSVSRSSSELRALAVEIDALGPDSVAAALHSEIAARARSYFAGLEAYRRHPFRRPDTVPPVLWRDGTTRLLDYGRDAVGPVVLVVPSLINRYYVLDILPERSFLGHLAAQGLRPVVVDWGAPGSDERHFDLSDYIVRRLETAFDVAIGIAGAPIGVIGYCMGGLLALALALPGPRRRPVSAREVW